MKAFIVEGKKEQDSIKLSGKDFHYLCQVRRHKKGDHFILRFSEGKSWVAEIMDMDDESCTVSLLEPIEGDGDIQWDIDLYICLPKGKKIDLMIRQATEAGVRRIFPLTSKHSIVKIKSPKEMEQKLQRWRRIVKEALQQSGSLVSTEIMAVRDFSDIIQAKQGRMFFLHQEELKSHSQWCKEDIDSFGMVVGPEGGFSEDEVRSMLKCDFSPVFLGKNVLRAETASIYGIAVLKTLLGV